MPRRSTASHTTSAVIAAAAAGLILSACGTDPEQGQASPDNGGAPSAPASAPAESSAANGNGEAPRVPDPIDVAPLDENPCAVLSDAQVRDRNFEPGEARVQQGTPECLYEYTDGSGSRVAFVQVPDFTNGLDDVYARKDAVALFEPTQVAGHPAVITSNYSDDRDEGYCDLQVGLADNYVMSVMVQVGEDSDDYPRGCEVAEAVAGDMIETLGGGA
ncbi:hypothetical protein BJF85_18480 [Saccharomonospora sp. CUA-673]|uniref:DUF3558 domain-containing protein n=1 Tax=Saccharomonospora sp. CUA-673 TaxID=1904969 RepID=UPI0009603F8B|nr:DUF3558 domain-containing protein [Saccharomonospora sp. CUA-673]OLT45475.1 hypothetical protein BJF85_18480 [Saccharomonospora sp. CUA-673]